MLERPLTHGSVIRAGTCGAKELVFPENSFLSLGEVVMKKLRSCSSKIVQCLSALLAVMLGLISRLNICGKIVV